VSSLIHLLNRIKLNGDVFTVYSKVDILYYSQNGKIEGLHLKNAILLSETYQRQSTLCMQSVPLQSGAHYNSFDPRDSNVRTQAASAVNQHSTPQPMIKSMDSRIAEETSSNTQCGNSSIVLVGIRAERHNPRCVVGNHSPVPSVPYCISCGNGRSSLDACIQSAKTRMASF
jgi:hypothetical protein